MVGNCTPCFPHIVEASDQRSVTPSPICERHLLLFRLDPSKTAKALYTTSAGGWNLRQFTYLGAGLNDAGRQAESLPIESATFQPTEWATSQLRRGWHMDEKTIEDSTRPAAVVHSAFSVFDRPRQNGKIRLPQEKRASCLLNFGM